MKHLFSVVFSPPKSFSGLQEKTGLLEGALLLTCFLINAKRNRKFPKISRYYKLLFLRNNTSLYIQSLWANATWRSVQEWRTVLAGCGWPAVKKGSWHIQQGVWNALLSESRPFSVMPAKWKELQWWHFRTAREVNAMWLSASQGKDNSTAPQTCQGGSWSSWIRSCRLQKAWVWYVLHDML